MTSTIAQTSQDLANKAAQAVDTLADKASDLANDAQKSVSKTIDNVKDQASDLTQDKVPGWVNTLTDKITELSEQSGSFAKDKAQLAKDKVLACADATSDRVRQDPLKAILVAVAAGAAIAAVAGYVSKKRASR